MNNLFKKAACFTDIHVGLKQNSTVHLSDCENYIDWFVDEAKSRNAETCIFLGDFMHHRSSINVRSMNTSVLILNKLSNNFEKLYFITGNHDLFFRDKRDLNSIEYARNFNNITIVDEHFLQGNVAIIPWLVGDEWKTLKKLKTKYIFGHFELPHFKMNAMIRMPESGQLNVSDLSNVEYVFSGHFHLRQKINNIHYIGNCFPHNYSDVHDYNRGAMFFRMG